MNIGEAVEALKHMRWMACLWLVLLVGCTQRQPAQPTVTSGTYDDASLCACRFICSPDNYEWTLKTVGPTNGGVCKCVGKTTP